MKEKYQDWIESIEWTQGLPEFGSPFATDLNSLRDFLQSLADMQEQEPDDKVISSGSEITFAVTKENRDWWRSKAIIAEQMRDQQNERVLGYQIQLRQKAEELAAANARIAEADKEHAALAKLSQALGNPAIEFDDSMAEALVNLAISRLTIVSAKDQPKRPLLMTHEQFGCILDLIRSATDEPTNFKRWND